MDLRLTKLEAQMLFDAAHAVGDDIDEYGMTYHEQQAYLRAIRKLREALAVEVRRGS